MKIAESDKYVRKSSAAGDEAGSESSAHSFTEAAPSQPAMSSDEHQAQRLTQPPAQGKISSPRKQIAAVSDQQNTDAEQTDVARELDKDATPSAHSGTQKKRTVEADTLTRQAVHRTSISTFPTLFCCSGSASQHQMSPACSVASATIALREK